MRKIALALVLALGLAGCAQLQTAFEAGKLVTASYTNPVTKNMLYNVENAMIVAFAGLNAYKQSCAAGAVDVHCHDNVAKIQAYTRQIPPLITRLRAFVKTNDQVNAIVVYNQVVGLINDMKAAAIGAGVPMGGV